jgi:hypothetical protein
MWNVFFADCHIILSWCRKPFPQLLNIPAVHDVSQTQIFTEEPLVSEKIAFEFALAIEKIED